MKTISRFTSCDVYILFWLLYNLQGVLYPSGSLISQGLLAIILLWSIFNCVRANQIGAKPLYFRGLNLLVLLFSVYGLIYMMVGPDLYITENEKSGVKKFGYLKDIYSSLLPIYSFYLFTKQGKLTEKSLRKWFYVFIVVAILQYVRSQREAMIAAMTNNSNVDGVTNNAGYLFVALIPGLLLLRNKPIVQNIVLALTMFLILISMKRGAILIGVLSLIIFFSYKLRYSSGRKKVGVILVVLLAVAASYFAVEYMMNTNDYFNGRVEATLAGDDSHRGEMYSNLWHTFLYDSTLLQMLIGRGAWGTLTVSFNFAHNDWLEILIDLGVTGVVIYIYYWLCFLRTCRNKRLPESSRICLYLVLLGCFTQTIFSMSYSGMNIYLTSVMGLCLAGGLGENSES